MSATSTLLQELPVRQGHSDNPDAAAAVREFADAVRQPEMAAVYFFCAPTYDLATIEKCLNETFGDTPVIGCTTAGEITCDGYSEQAITGFSLSSDHFEVANTLISDLRTFSIEDVGDQVTRSLDQIGADQIPAKALSTTTFGMLLVDGMSKQEEIVISTLYSAVDPIPLFGGSAGDGLRFRSTSIFADGRFHANSAVLSLVRSTFAFKVFKFDHFRPTDRKMVVTGANPHQRLVSEINAEKAAPEYARLVGLDERQLSPMVFAAYPVMVRVGGEYHARSIQQVEEDGSLRFYCAIDEGLVLTVAEGQEISGSLDGALEDLKDEMGPMQLVLGFDCILRRLEAEQKQSMRKISDTLKKHKVVGFNTYGEQYRSMHVNQTFTGVAISTRRIDSEL